MSLLDFQIISKLGDGSYSSVYKVKRLEDGQEYALKKVKMINLSDREKENALNEVRILASIKHKNVASYKQAFFDEPSSSLCIVMEYADNGDVFQKICEHQQTATFMKEKVIWKILIQAVRGLKALHDLRILHRDMKSANIFLWKDYTAKLGDLNVSKVAKKGLLYTQTGTPYYASPEVWKDQPYDLKSDIWSLGCVIYEMCALVPPFRADDMNGLFKRVLKGSYPQIPSQYSMDLRQVIKSLLQVNSAQRPNTDQILDMNVIKYRTKKYFKDDQVLTKETGDMSESELLKTIKFSRNIFKLKLPQPTYEQLQFATMPSHHYTGKAIAISRNQGQPSNSKTINVIENRSNLPKINAQSTKNNNSVLLNKSLNSAEAEGEDDYEQDFENAEDPQQYHANKQKPKSRSYSAKKASIKKRIANIQGQHSALSIENNNQSMITEQKPLLSQRSRNNLSEDASQSLPQIGKQSPKVTPIGTNKQESSESRPLVQGSGGVLQTLDNHPSQIPQAASQGQQPPNIGQQYSGIKHKKQLIKQQSNMDTSIDKQTILEKASDLEEEEDGGEGISISLNKLPGLDNQISISAKRAKKKKSGNLAGNASSSAIPSLQQPTLINSVSGGAINSSNQDLSISESKKKILAVARDTAVQSALDVNQSQLQLNIQTKGKDERKPQHAPTQSDQVKAAYQSPPVYPLQQQHIHQIQHQQQQSPQSNHQLQNGVHSEQSPLTKIQANASALGQNPGILNKNVQPQAMIVKYKPSSNVQRVVNAYSLNKIKKKKYMLINSNNISSISANRDEDIKIKLQQLREGIGYYENQGGVVKSNNYRDYSMDMPTGGAGLLSSNASINGGGGSRNNSVLLPELKTVTPQIHNVKMQYGISQLQPHGGGSGLTIDSSKMAKKPSYERIMRLDHQLHNLYKLQPKIELSQPMLYNRGRKQQNDVAKELDIQGKSVGGAGPHASIGGSNSGLSNIRHPSNPPPPVNL